MATCSASAACEDRRLGLPELSLEPCQRVTQRLHELLHRCLPGVQVARCADVGCAQPALGHLQEGSRAALKSLRGQRLEAVGQLAVEQIGALPGRLRQQRGALISGSGPLVRGPGLTGQVGCHASQPAARQQIADGGAEEGPQQESEEKRERVHIQHACSRW